MQKLFVYPMGISTNNKTSLLDNVNGSITLQISGMTIVCSFTKSDVTVANHAASVLRRTLSLANDYLCEPGPGNVG